MTLKEQVPTGKRSIYPDGTLIARSVLARSFDCSPFAVERICKNVNISMIYKTGSHDPTTKQPFVPIDKFPELISAIQKARHGKEKIKTKDVDTSKDFTVETASGTIYEYTYPQRKE